MTIFLACGLTLLIEVPFLILCGFRSRDHITAAAAANVLTNLSLNLAFRCFLPYTPGVIFSAEAAVVGAEFALYALCFGPSAKLFFLTLAANALSWGIGTILM